MALSDDDKEIIVQAKSRFERCIAWESQARINALADTKFANGDVFNMYQWDQGVRTQRAGRPCLTNNKVRQHNLHVVNDARQHKAAIKVTPTGGGATFEAAEVYSSIIRRIEYQSKAVDAYSTAIYHQVESGLGYVRVTTDYADETSFDQEIFIRRVKDPKCIYVDPDASEYDKADMRFAFWFDWVPRKEFEAKYPDMPTDTSPAFDYRDSGASWDTKDHVLEAEYWRRGERSHTLYELIDGSTVRDGDLPAGALDMLKQQGAIKRSRKVAEPEIEWFQIAGNKIIDRKVWPGRYIPIVPFIGEETVIDGVMDRKGHTRAMIDAQKQYNYWNSAAVEHVALQTKVPYVGALKAFEGLEAYWRQANVENYPYLPYNDRDPDDPKTPIERPERSQPPQMAQAYLQGMQVSRQDMMEVSGQYTAEMGAPGNERSGVAIQQRQREGDTSTYHFIDNQAKGIRQIGRVCMDLIPKIYDVARVIKIMAADGTQSDVHLDPEAQAAHQQAMPPQGPGQPPTPVTPEQAQAAQEDENSPNPLVIFNPNVGRYDVEADVGPSFGTQREEAANAFSQIMANNKEAFQIVGDFWARNSDFPGADELAERLKKGLPPQYAGMNPQVMQLQQAMQQQGAQAHDLLGKADAEVAHLKAELALAQEAAKDKSADIAIRDYDSETKRLSAIGAVDPTAIKVIVRSMLSEMLGMPALPIMHEHDAADAAHMQEIMPPDADGATSSAVNGAGA